MTDEHDDVLITGPGKYPTREGNVVTVGMRNFGGGFVALNSPHGFYYMANGRANPVSAWSQDIIGPRIPDPDTQDGSVGVEQPRRAGDATHPLTAFERFGEYMTRPREGACTLIVETWGAGQYHANFERLDVEGMPLLETNTYGETPESALKAVMDVLEGLA